MAERPPADEVPGPPVVEHHHRDLSGGQARAAVFGASDGLVSNVSLILGVAGADPGADIVRLAGLAGLIAGAVSMAAGEYGSMKAQSELLERELELERIELHRNPHVEMVELSQIYQSRGLEPEMARELAERMMSDPERALETHAREELGIDPQALGSPIGAAVSSFLAFALGALLPLLPWFFTEGTAAIVGSMVLGLTGAASLGLALAVFTRGSRLRLAARYTVIAATSAAITYAIGRAVGVNTG
jgi:VIT1/CCC1 family predicted Fe2+/Mn2+ transporter